MCDLAYTIQAEQIERRALAELALAPHVEGKGQIAPPEVALAEFEAWLNAEPPEARSDGGADELTDLIAGGRR